MLSLRVMMEPARAMTLNNVDLNLFVVFDTIYSERNLTRASEVLNITQPAVSNALARLRATFDDPLFVRTGRTMSPTPAAQNAIGPVQQALRQLRASVDQFGRFDPQTSQRTFHICQRDASALMLMPDLIKALRVSAPGIRVHCHQLDRAHAPVELASGQVDFVVDTLLPHRGDLNGTPIYTDRYVCVLRKGHPLASKMLTLERYLALDHILVSGRRRGRGLVDIALGRLGKQSNTVLRVPHFQPAFHVVMETDMSVSAPLSLARRYDVIIKELPFEPITLDSTLYWHKKADLDPASIWMRNQILAAGRRQRQSKLRRAQVGS